MDPVDHMIGLRGPGAGGQVMDGVSPGALLASLGEVQTCIVDWPLVAWPPVQQLAPAHTHYHFTPAPPRLSDEDVERIAKRVAEMLGAGR